MRSKTVWRGIVLAALLTAVSIGAVSAGAAPGHAKVTWPNASQEIAKSGVFNLPFCGSKPRIS